MGNCNKSNEDESNEDESNEDEPNEYTWNGKKSLNEICFCGKPLKEYIHNGATTNCRNCCREISTDNDSSILIHICLEKDCLYKSLADMAYVVCIDCYNDNIDHFKYNLDDVDEMEFMPTKSEAYWTTL